MSKNSVIKPAMFAAAAIVCVLVMVFSKSANANKAHAIAEKEFVIASKGFLSLEDLENLGYKLPQYTDITTRKPINYKTRYNDSKFIYTFGHWYVFDIDPDGQCYKRTLNEGHSSHMSKTDCTPEVLDAIGPTRLKRVPKEKIKVVE